MAHYAQAMRLIKMVDSDQKAIPLPSCIRFVWDWVALNIRLTAAGVDALYGRKTQKTYGEALRMREAGVSLYGAGVKPFKMIGRLVPIGV